jgi:hypothetical protein
MKAKFLGLGFPGPKPFRHDAAPEPPGRPIFGDFFKEIIMGVKEKGEARGEVVHRQTPTPQFLCTGNAVCQTEA